MRLWGIMFLALLTGLTQCPGAIIVQYDFSGQPGNQGATPVTATATGLTASDLVRGPGVSASSTANSMNSSAWTTSTVADLNDYYGFTLTANAGYSLTLTSLSFAERRSPTGIRMFELRSSLDGFTAAIPGTVTSVPNNDSVRNQTLSLGSGFSDLLTPVTFRLYGYEAESGSGTWRLQNHSTFAGLVMDGTITAVPEPGTFAAVGLMSLLSWGLRRKKGSGLFFCVM